VVDRRAEGGTDTPHYQIQVDGGGVDFRVAVNVLSKQHPSELLYLADETFQHPIVQHLAALPDGFAPLPSTPGGLALDFIRANLFDRTMMRTVPATVPGPDNDLADKLDHFVARAAADPAARVYAFGQRWGPEQGTPDKVSGSHPATGSTIHMNQGNSQSQAWHTDDQTGHAIAGPEPGEPAAPEHTVRIVVALVNPGRPAPEAETVTVLNASAGDSDLAGWSILDREKRQLVLDGGVLPSGTRSGYASGHRSRSATAAG
jgi:uncharacterized protein YukJ